MRVLVTGGTGHLGGSLVSLLRAQRHQVRILARKPGQPAEGVEWVRGDLATCSGIPEAVNGVDVIIHAATDS
ncbi:MAG TPA: NmrA family NAD(P)-binding protein, partial [Gemmatimonadaceae bacterium]